MRRSATLGVTCDRAAKFAVIAFDGQQGGETGRHAFVLTDASGARIVGGLVMSASSILLDRAVGIGMEWDGEEGYKSIEQIGAAPLHWLRLWPARPVAFQFPKSPLGEPSAFKALTLGLNVLPWLEPKNKIDATELVGIKGAVTFELLVL